MKLLALGRINSARPVKYRLAGEVAKFTEKAIITLRILSSVGDRDPLRATLALTSSTEGRVWHRPALSRAVWFDSWCSCGYRQSFHCCRCWWCCHSHSPTFTWLAVFLVDRAEENRFPFHSVYIHADNVWWGPYSYLVVIIPTTQPLFLFPLMTTTYEGSFLKILVSVPSEKSFVWPILIHINIPTSDHFI